MLVLFARVLRYVRRAEICFEDFENLHLLPFLLEDQGAGSRPL
jgi:hypothetical protein